MFFILNWCGETDLIWPHGCGATASMNLEDSQTPRHAAKRCGFQPNPRRFGIVGTDIIWIYLGMVRCFHSISRYLEHMLAEASQTENHPMAVAISDLKRAIARPLQCRRKSERTWKDSCLRAAVLSGFGLGVTESLLKRAPFRRPGLFSRNQKPFLLLPTLCIFVSPYPSRYRTPSISFKHFFRSFCPQMKDHPAMGQRNFAEFGWFWTSKSNPALFRWSVQPRGQGCKEITTLDAWWCMVRLRWIQLYRYVQYI